MSGSVCVGHVACRGLTFCADNSAEASRGKFKLCPTESGLLIISFIGGCPIQINLLAAFKCI